MIDKSLRINFNYYKDSYIGEIKLGEFSSFYEEVCLHENVDFEAEENYDYEAGYEFTLLSEGKNKINNILNSFQELDKWVFKSLDIDFSDCIMVSDNLEEIKEAIIRYHTQFKELQKLKDNKMVLIGPNGKRYLVKISLEEMDDYIFWTNLKFGIN